MHSVLSDISYAFGVSVWCLVNDWSSWESVQLIRVLLTWAYSFGLGQTILLLHPRTLYHSIVLATLVQYKCELCAPKLNHSTLLIIMNQVMIPSCKLWMICRAKMDQLHISENILITCRLNVTSLPEYFLQPFCNANVWCVLEKAMVFKLCGQPEFTVCAKI